MIKRELTVSCDICNDVWCRYAISIRKLEVRRSFFGEDYVYSNQKENLTLFICSKCLDGLKSVIRKEVKREHVN